jgi:hypothetical protein
MGEGLDTFWSVERVNLLFQANQTVLGLRQPYFLIRNVDKELRKASSRQLTK